jgi:hypothetical protein
VGIAIAIIIVAAIALGVGVSLGLRRRKRRQAPLPETSPRAPRPEPAPMTGLEDALAKATDRTGTTMRDRLDAESAHVDELRVTDDTGPILRRALDRVDPAQRRGAEDATHSANEPSDEPGSS